MGRPPFPKSLRQFQANFASEEACQAYLAACRWPDGFVCPACGGCRAYESVKQRRWQCSGCRHQVSLTAGTILHNTKTPLTTWFWAAYLIATDKRGISALLLQRQLGLPRYETAWMILHKFRRAMVNLTREPLKGEVEIDDTWVEAPRWGLRGSRDEFVFRHNRRKTPMAAFQTLLGLGASRGPTAYARLRGAKDMLEASDHKI